MKSYNLAIATEEHHRGERSSNTFLFKMHTFLSFYLDCWYEGSGEVRAEPRGEGQLADVLVIPQAAGDGLLAQQLQAGDPVLHSDNVQRGPRSHQQARIPVTPTDRDDGTLHEEQKDTTSKDFVQKIFFQDGCTTSDHMNSDRSHYPNSSRNLKCPPLPPECEHLK